MFIKKISENKSLAIGISRMERFRTVFSFEFSWTVNCDHAGLSVYIQIYKHLYSFELTDRRHWDYDNDRFEELK